MFSRFRAFIQKSLLAGIFAALPLAVTYWFITFVFKKFSGFFLPYIAILATKYDIHIPFIYQKVASFVIIVVLLIMIGIIAKNYLGKKLLGLVESIASNIPIVRSVYSSIRQIVEAFQNASGSNFKKVVIIEYPREGLYSMGFITKDSCEFLNKATGEICTNIFVPTTPNPTSGFILIVPKKDIIDPDISIDQGVKFVISAGLVEPFDSCTLEKIENKEI